MIRRMLCAAITCCALVSQAVFGGGARPGTEVDLAATALFMGGTNQILSVGPSSPDFIRHYVDWMQGYYVKPSGFCADGNSGCAPVAVYTPEQWGPLTGLTDLPLDASIAAGVTNLDACLRGSACIATLPPFTSTAVQPIDASAYVVTGGSQSAIIASHEKAALIADPAQATVSFVLVSSPSRPNGGFLERFVGLYIPLIGLDFSGATPTNSLRENPFLTVDYARQYDGWDDFPNNPLNLLSTVNAVLGSAYLHSNYIFEDGPPLLQGYYQDTTYYLGATLLLPLVRPIAAIPAIGLPLAKALDPPLRVLVESGYDRTINPGQPTPADFTYFPNPLKTLHNVAVAIPTGWDDAISHITGNPADRPFGTEPQSTYGVGGPPVYAGAIDPYVEPATESATQVTEATRQVGKEIPRSRSVARAATRARPSAADCSACGSGANTKAQRSRPLSSS